VENVNFLDSGTKLVMRPYIAPDGLVRLEVHPERSSAVLDTNTGLPNQTTTEVTTNVMVRDGTTVVIGGLIEEQVVESYSRVPILGAIPFAGRLFRNKTESTDRTELIVLITPRIVREPDAEIEGESFRVENERRTE
jgi:type II secretory pathway component GspD/PulD (secretin)